MCDQGGQIYLPICTGISPRRYHQYACSKSTLSAQWLTVASASALLFLALSVNLVLPLCPAVCSDSSSTFVLSVCYPSPLCPNWKAHHTMSTPSTSTVNLGIHPTSY